MSKSIVFAFFILFIGCTFGIENSVRIGEIPEPDIADLPKLYGTNVSIRKFSDERRGATIGVVEGESLSYDGELGFLVKDGLETAFKKAGADVESFGATRVEGSIDELKLVTEQRFGVFTAKASAEITARVVTKDGRTAIYTGKYSGGSERKTPYLNSTQLESMIGEALKLAVTEIVSDKGLLERLGS